MTTRKYSSRSQQTTLTGAITSGATSMTVVSGTALLGGVTIPAGTTFTLVIDVDTALEEIIDATAVSTNTFTITRAIDGSSAQDHSAGAVVRHMAIGRDYRDANLHTEASAYYNDGSGSGHTMHGIGSGEGDVVGTLKTQTLTNKTLTAPTISDPTITGTASAGAVLVFEGATADAYETTLTVVDPTQDNTVTIPNTTGTVVLDSATQTLTNKTLTSPTISGSPVITGLSSVGMVTTSATPKSYVDSILGSATAAATSAASAATSASSAATSASSAATSATASATSASASATSASAAATSATSAAASATAASTSASSAATSATSAQAWAIQLVTPVSGTDYSAKYNANLAATSASSAATSASSAATSASSAATSATSAANSATASATSASAAATSATSAAASATAAATSATSAAASATAAATSATSAAASATAAAGYVVPSQTGNAGKFLATDGTAVSWSNSATSFIPTGSTIPANGMYLPAANALGFATNSTERMRIDSNGNVGIGTTPFTQYSFLLGKNITGGVTSYGFSNQGVIQSDVTTETRLFQTVAQTQAATFTLPIIRHYLASQGTFGLNSTVTDQYGFYAGATLTGASNNFGFYGAIASGTNRWNFYAGGTAANYFAGQTTVGSTSLTLGSVSVAQQFGVVSTTATNVGMVIRGAASQTGDLTQWQNSAGTLLANVSSAGLFWLGDNTALAGRTPLNAVMSTNTGVGDSLILRKSVDGTNSTNFSLARSRGTNASPTALTSGDSIGSVAFHAYDGTTYLQVGQILCTVDGTSGTSDMPTRLTFLTTADGAASGTERMRIDSSGNVGIGTTSPTALSNYGSLTLNGTTGSLLSHMLNGTENFRIQTYSGFTVFNEIVSGGLAFNTNNTERMRIDSSGNTTINSIAAGTTSTAAVGGGYMGLPQNSTTTGAYTVVAADAGKHIYSTATRTVTIDSNANLALPVGTTLTFISGVGATTTIAITTDTMYLAGTGTTGSRTLAAHGMATAVKVASTTWYISGNGLT